MVASLRNSAGPAPSHLFRTPATLPPDAPTLGRHPTFLSPGAKSGNRDKGPSADGSIADLERPTSPGVNWRPSFSRPPPSRARLLPPGRAGSRWSRSVAGTPASPRADIPRAHCEQKSETCCSQRRENDSASGGGKKLEKHLQGVLWALFAEPGN